MLKTVNNCYMVTELIEDGMTDPRLEKLKAQYMKPVYIEDSQLGKFTLNREFSWFEGSVDWLGQDCSVTLDTDRDGGKTANRAFAYLKTLYSDLENWDIKFRKYAVQECLETANEWSQEDDEITEDDFFEMIYIAELSINPRGDLVLYYIEDREIFGGHAIQISVNLKNGKFDGTSLVG